MKIRVATCGLPESSQLAKKSPPVGLKMAPSVGELTPTTRARRQRKGYSMGLKKWLYIFN
jgi:hypothetical protein